MSVPAFAWALERGRTLDLSPACRLVLIYLADMANGERVCWPGQQTIADFTGLAVRTVRSAIHGLAELQLIRVDAKPGFAARFHILRPDTPANGAEVKAAHPGKMSRATPANGADHPRQNVPTHPGTSLQEGRHITTVTPANGADDPSITQVRDPKRRASAPEARKDSQNSEPQGGTPPPAPPPPQAPVIGTTPGGSSYKPPTPQFESPDKARAVFQAFLAAKRQQAHPEPEPAADPLKTKRAAAATIFHLRKYATAPGAKPERSRTEQIDAITQPTTNVVGEIQPPIRRGPLDPVRTVTEQLAALGYPQVVEHAS